MSKEPWANTAWSSKAQNSVTESPPYFSSTKTPPPRKTHLRKRNWKTMPHCKCRSFLNFFFFFFPCMEARRPWETEFWVWILTWLGPRLRFSSWLWTKLFNPQFLPLQSENPTIKLLGWYDVIPKRKSLHPAPLYPFLLSYPQLLVQFSVLSSSAVLLSIDIFTEGSMAMRMHLPEMSLIL